MAAAIATTLNGKWVLDHKRSDSIGPFLKEMGVPWLIIKMAQGSTPTWEITLTDGGMKHVVHGPRGITITDYLFDREVVATMGDGSKHPASLHLSPSGELSTVVKHASKGDIVTTYETPAGAEPVLVATIRLRRAGVEVLAIKRTFVRK